MSPSGPAPLEQKSPDSSRQGTTNVRLYVRPTTGFHHVLERKVLNSIFSENVSRSWVRNLLTLLPAENVEPASLP